MTVKILTVCAQGLCRSVGLADVLKLHFEPVDVIPVGYSGNTAFTLDMLVNNWADFVVCMEAKYVAKLEKKLQQTKKEWKAEVLVCDVGPDTYGNSHNPGLIDQCWRWARANQLQLGIREHRRKL